MGPQKHHGGVAVALTGVTVECMNKATAVETLLIIKGRAEINTRTMKRQGCAVFYPGAYHCQRMENEKLVT